jgi:hypothetical protein
MVARARLGVLALALVACSLALAAAPSSAPAAGTYDVNICSSVSADGLSIVPNVDALTTHILCAQLNPKLEQLGQSVSPQSGTTSWTLTAPNPSVRIAALSANVAFTGPWTTATRWNLTAGNGNLLDTYLGNAGGSNPVPQGGRFTYALPADGGGSIISSLQCPVNVTCPGSSLGVTFTDVTATLTDARGPAISALLGSVATPGTMTGQRSARFSASDAGGGIAKVAVLVDGNEFLSLVDENGGLCRIPYTVLVPCSQTENPDFEFLSYQLADGTHQVQAEAIDAAGNVSLSDPVTIVTHNAPANTTPPAIQGTPKLGATLTATNGTWDGNPLALHFSYQWLRCPASVTTAAGAGGCKAIAGATGQQYALTSADVYGRMIVRVTASNGSVTTTDATSAPTDLVADANGRTTPPAGGGGGSGGGTGGGPTGTLDTTPPLLSAVSLTRARFRAARTAAGRATLLRLTSSEGGRLSIAVVRVRPGQRRGRACRVVRRPVRRGRCTVLSPAGALTRMIGAGRSSVALSGRIGSRALAPGSYRLVLTVRDGAANVSKAVTRSFAIVR